MRSRERASRPFDAGRDGFVISEGAAMLVLEELDHARARGAHIYCEVVGYASGNDAFHMVQPKDQGEGAASVMRAALRQAARLGDLRPVRHRLHQCPRHLDAVQRSLRDGGDQGRLRRPRLSARRLVDQEHDRPHVRRRRRPRGAGLRQGASSGGCLPPTINYEVPDPDCDLDYVPNVARPWQPTATLSNSFGLGGHNACVIFREVSDLRNVGARLRRRRFGKCRGELERSGPGDGEGSGRSSRIVHR